MTASIWLADDFRRCTNPWRALAGALLIAVLVACAPPDPAESLASAESSYAAGDYRTASIHLQNVLRQQPENAGARLLAGRMALLTGDVALARGHLEAARAGGVELEVYGLALAEAYAATGAAPAATALLESMPPAMRGAPYWRLVAEIRLAGGQIDDAARALDSALAAGEATAPLLLTAARVAGVRGQSEEAANLVEQAVALDGESAEAFALRGSLHSAAGRLDEAAADLGRAVELYRGSFRALLAAPILLRLVQVDVARNALDSASSAATALAELVPNSAFGAYAQGLVAFQRGDFPETISQLRQAINQQPEQAQFLVLLGAAHLASGNFGQAEQQFQSVLSRNPSDPAAIRLLAEARIRQQRPRAALDALSLFDARSDTEDLALLSLLGAAYLQDGEPELAIPYLEQALDLNPTDQATAMQLAQAYAASGRSTDAGELLRATPGIPPDQAYSGNLAVVLNALQTGDPAAADEYVQDLLADQGDNPGAQMVAAVYRQLTNDPDGARAAAEAALAIDPQFVPAHLMRAALLAEAGRVDDATAALDEVTALDPANLAAWVSLARLAIDAGELDAAERHLEIASERTDSIVAPIALARLQLSRGRLAAATQSVETAAGRSPDDPRVALTRGMVALAGDETAEAVAALRLAVAGLPELPNVALALAQAQIRMQDSRGAYETVRDAAARMPGVVGLRAALGAAAIGIGNRDEALRIALQLQSELNQQAAGFALEGQLRMSERDYDAARRLFEQAYSRERSWALLLNLVAASTLSSTPGGEAALVEEWLADSPGDVGARVYLAELWRSAGNLTEAMNHYEQVFALDAENVVALNNAAWVAHQLARDDALDYANRAAVLAPDNGPVLDTLGWILTERGRPQEALPHLARAVELTPQIPEIRYHLGVAQARAGQERAARETLQALLNEGDAFEQREDAARLLDTL